MDFETTSFASHAWLEKEPRLIFHDVEKLPELPQEFLAGSANAQPAEDPGTIEWTNPPLPEAEKKNEEPAHPVRKMLAALKAMVKGTNMQKEANQ